MVFKKINITYRFIFITISIFLSGCSQLEIFEKSTPIPAYQWDTNFAATGSFDITDTTSLYQLYIIIRHTDAYKYNNIWLNIGFQAPADTIFKEKKEIALGTDATGWFGTGMNDIWEFRQPLTTMPSKFKKPGTYHFTIQHIMRDEPLANIMAAGLRIQKVTY